MRGDPEEPGSKLRGRLVRTPRTVHAQKHFLRQFLRYGVILDHSIEEMNHGQAVLVQQNTEARAISILDAKHQLRIVVQGRRGSPHIRLNPFGPSEVALPALNIFTGYLSATLPSATAPSSAESHRAATRRSAASETSVRRWAFPPEYRFARSTAAFVVLIPSATIFMELTISSSFRPCANSTPTVRFRLRSPVQVRTRSPSPASPARVWAPARPWPPPDGSSPLTPG